MKFEKQYKKTTITKAYDLLELKANGRIDEAGDYLDDEGNKLTYTGYKDDLHGAVHKTDMGDCIVAKYVNTLENKADRVHENGFICIGVAGEKWCVRRDIFLATYEEIK